MRQKDHNVKLVKFLYFLDRHMLMSLESQAVQKDIIGGEVAYGNGDKEYAAKQFYEFLLLKSLRVCQMVKGNTITPFITMMGKIMIRDRCTEFTNYVLMNNERIEHFTQCSFANFLAKTANTNDNYSSLIYSYPSISQCSNLNNQLNLF